MDCEFLRPLLGIVFDIRDIRPVSHALTKEGQVWRAHNHVKQRVIRVIQCVIYLSPDSIESTSQRSILLMPTLHHTIPDSTELTLRFLGYSDRVQNCCPD